MASDLQVRPATPEDTDRILDLVRLSLGEGTIPRHFDYWRWKHRDSPFGPSPCLLAESGGLVVGLRVFMSWSWRARGVILPAVRAVDTATHPDWRGRGIFTRLTRGLLERMREEGVAFVFNTPNSQSLPGYLKMGWGTVGHISFWFRPLRPLKLIGSLLSSRNSGPPVTGAGSGLDGGAAARDLFEEPGFPRFLDALPDRPDRFATPRTGEYLRWRYEAIPGFAYRAVWSLDEDGGAAIIFRSKDTKGLRELRICELLVGHASRSRRIARNLLYALVRSTEAHYATAMAVSDTPEARALLRSGFLPAPRLGPVLAVRPLNELKIGLDPLRRSHWRLCIGDLELF